jgi:drug/metabolite transporter (DMT)-like permease
VSESESVSMSEPVAVPGSRVLLQGLAFATVYLIWGSTYLGIRIGVRSLPPFLMAGGRYLLAGLVLYAVLRATGVGPPTRAQWLRSGAAGVVMLAVGNGFVTWAEQRVPSNFAALLVSAVPLYVAVIEWLRPGGQRPGPAQMVGIVVGGIGMALLVWPTATPAASVNPSEAGPNFLGIAAILIAGLAWAGGSLYARYSLHHPNALMAAAQQMIAGAVALLIIGVARGEASREKLAAITSTGVLAFVYLTLFGSLLAYSAFGWLITVSTPSRLSTTAFVNPVVAVILGWLLLDETLSGRAMVGAAAIVCAVLVMTLGLRPLRAPLALLRGWRARA